MALEQANGRPILVTGAAGDVGAIGRKLTTMLLEKGHRVRALVRREDERADALECLDTIVSINIKATSARERLNHHGCLHSTS